jgi:Ca2+-binding RTX toxin-like protein
MVTYALGENVENLTLAGVGAINGTGNSLANLIVGNGANNILTGGLGNDTLMGSAGQDQFVFNAAPSSMNVDTVSDFQVRTDKLLLSKAIFLKFAAVSLGQAPSADNFVKGTAALDANDYLIYNVATGVLSYDADGSGKASVATAFAKIELNGVPPSDLSAADFIISA